MPSNFCLTPQFAEKFKKMIKSGEVNVDKLARSSSEYRRNYFKIIFKDERIAKEVNALLEEKLLLKHQKLGLVNWAKQITGIKPEVQRDLVSRIEKMDKLLSPESEQGFLADLTARRLGTDVSIDEAKKIMELSDNVKKLKDFKTEAERIDYGRAKLELSNYVNSLNPEKPDLFTNLAGIPRSVMSSIDLSAPLNQGWGMMSRKEFYGAFRDMFKYVKSDANLLDLQADIITRPNYKAAKKAGLRLTDLGNELEKREENFMTTIIDKIPGVGGLLRASQRAYTGFLNKLRMDVFDDLLSKAEIAGEDVGVGSKVLEDIAKVINNFTGGAVPIGIKKGMEGNVPLLNAVFFSPRKISSTLNILNPINYLDPKISPTARKAAVRNLIGSLSLSAGIIALARILGSEKPETDPRSTDFGKIRIGDSRLDVSGGNATYLTLLSRLLSGQTKNQKGVVKDLGSKIGQTSAFDLLGQAGRYKLSPNASFIIDWVSKSNAIGEPKTVPQSVIDRLKPMFLNSFVELLKDDTTGAFTKAMLSIGALFGGGLNTYSPQSTKKSIPLKQ